jgi:hypothetical protein
MAALVRGVGDDKTITPSFFQLSLFLSSELVFNKLFLSMNRMVFV